MSVLIDQALPIVVSKLDSEDARRVWVFLAKLIEDPAHPSLSLERLERSRSLHLWSGRISRSLRAILHKQGEYWTVLYAGHHDQAYAWANRRQIGPHPATGTLQIVEIPESLGEYPTQISAPPSLFDTCSDDYLISLGLATVWLPLLRQVRSEDDLLQILPQLPSEVQDRLLTLATGEWVLPPPHPDPASRATSDAHPRFFLLERNPDLLKLLEAPLATWIVFLHPSQQRLATGSFSGPLKITGSAGTGKTVVALHRARHLARQGKRVLLTSFMSSLCHSLRSNLRVLCTPEELAQITVETVHSQAFALLKTLGDPITPVDRQQIKTLLERYISPAPRPLSLDQLLIEWERVIQDQGIRLWEQYRQADRSGRGLPLTTQARAQVWSTVVEVLTELESRDQMEWSGICLRVREALEQGQIHSPYDAVIVDEVQDLRPQELRLLATLAGEGPDRLTLIGDGQQRIFSGRTRLSSVGIDVRGRSYVLKVTYRTTEQIRSFAEQVIKPHPWPDRPARAAASNPDLDRQDFLTSRRGTLSLLVGPEPQLHRCQTEAEQLAFVTQQLQRVIQEGVQWNEMAIFARTHQRVRSLAHDLGHQNIPTQILGRQSSSREQAVNLGTMHRAKGLEFKVVLLVGVSLDQLPLRQVIERTPDPLIRQECLQKERHLLYVSLTRARDELLISWVGEPSRFLPYF